MCIIVTIERGAVTPSAYDTLRACSLCNSDSWSFIFTDSKGRDVVKKKLGLMDKKGFDKILKANQTSPVVCHYRIATGSDVNLLNQHPFKVGNINIFHNGILFNSDSKFSDTMILCNSLKVIDKWSIMLLQKMSETNFDKFCLYKGGKIVRIGKYETGEDRGFYFSNNNYLFYKNGSNIKDLLRGEMLNFKDYEEIEL